MVKDHSGSEKVNSCCRHGSSATIFPMVDSIGFFLYAASAHTTGGDDAHTTAFVTPVVDHWLESRTSSSVGPPHEGSFPTTYCCHERTLLPRMSDISLLNKNLSIVRHLIAK